MASDSGKEYRMVCKNEHIEKHFIWQSDIDAKKVSINCTICNCKLRIQEEQIFGIAPGLIGKFQKGRPMKERKERSQKDFVKNILPTLGGSERKHFQKKYSKKK